MFKTIKEALSFIESQRVKRSFEDFQKIVDRYHFNVNLKNVIHVAGTNGKGSTVTFIKDLFMTQGYHVGTFTSPYIIKHNERIAVDGKPISDLDLLRLINQLYPIIEKEHLSMFEIDTLIMLSYFNELDLDYHVIECGIGGLNDKTNVIQSKIAVITNIGYDHQFMLGNTLLDIACHKAGIIKERVPLFTTEKNQKIFYPGSTISLGFDELGKHGVLVCDIEKDNLKVEFKTIDKREYAELEIDISEMSSNEEVIEEFEKLLLKQSNLYKVILTGKRFFPLDLDEIKKMVQTENIVKIKDKTKLGINIEQIANENNIKGIFVKNMLEKKEKENLDDDFIEKAIEIGLEVL